MRARRLFPRKVGEFFSRRLCPRKAMRARLVVFSIKGRNWRLTRSLHTFSGSQSSSYSSPNSEDLTVNGSGDENLETIADFVANKISRRRQQNPKPFDPIASSQTLEKAHYFSSRNPRIGSLLRCRSLDGFTHNLSVASFSSFSSGTVKDEKKEQRSHSSWIDRYLPAGLRPYALLARLDKPIGTWLLAWPCFWSITLAASPGHLPDMKMLALFGSGAVLLRGAGCTVNDLLDSDIDVKVERTKYRPIASGILTTFQGLSFLCFQLMLGLGILLQLNNYSRVLGASSLLLVFSYPLMKRLTFWPQAYLGLTFNWGALLGWAAIKESLDPAIVIPLYSAGVFWTLVYDTIYAHQDKEDDMKVGVKSTALRFGSLTKNWIGGFGIACIGSFVVSGYNAELAWPYYPFLGVAAGQLAWQILTVDLANRADCNKKFVSNKWFGALVFSGILVGRLAS